MTAKRGGNSPYHIDGIDYSKNESGYIAYRIGIFGWRKRCLYFLILLVLIMAVVNLALIIWMLRAQDFGLHGMGKLYITSNGIRVEGVAEFIAALKLKEIITNAPLQINSKRNISLSAVDEHNNVLGHVTLSSNKIILQNKELLIKDHHGNILLHANEDKLKMDIPNMDIIVPGGLKLNDKLESSRIRTEDVDLHLESPLKKIQMKSASDFLLNAQASNMRLQSLQDTKLVAKGGMVSLDAHNIKFGKLKMSTLLGDHLGYDGIAEVCMCRDGRLFLAPPLRRNQCKIQAGVCS